MLWWEIARAAGLTTWVLFALSTAAGIATATRVLGRRVPSAWLLSVHRALGGLAVTFLGVHLLAIVADSYVHIGVVDVLVPFASGWRTVAVAWGIVAAWLLAAVEATSLVRHRLPTKAWRWIHLSSYATFVASTIHLFTAGSDTYGLAIRTVVVLLTGAVALLSMAAVLDLARTAPPGSTELSDRPAAHPRSADLVG